MHNSGEQAAGVSSRGRRALGRGLDALLPSVAPGLQTIDPLQIEPNPDQPRQHFEPEALQSLAESLRQHGVLQPLVVTVIGPERYRLILGERRWQAAKLAGLREIPVVVREASDRQSLELALVENVHRRDLNPLEEAAAYHRLIEDFGLTQQDVATQVGRSRVTVTNTLRLLALSESLKHALIDGRISEGHARALLGLPNGEQQLTALDLVERNGMSVRQTEQLVRRLQRGTRGSHIDSSKDANVAAAEDDLRRSLGTKVTLKPGKRGGRIVIEYYSFEEFESLYRRLLGES